MGRGNPEDRSEGELVPSILSLWRSPLSRLPPLRHAMRATSPASTGEHTRRSGRERLYDRFVVYQRKCRDRFALSQSRLIIVMLSVSETSPGRAVFCGACIYVYSALPFCFFNSSRICVSNCSCVGGAFLASSARRSSSAFLSAAIFSCSRTRISFVVRPLRRN